MLENHMVVGDYYPPERKIGVENGIRCRHCGQWHHEDDIGETWVYVFGDKHSPGECRCAPDCVFFCRDCGDEIVSEEDEICKSCAEMALCGY